MFIKGQSGNPSGRPKNTHDVRMLAKRYTHEALEKLVEWMRSDNAKASVSAAMAILDRAHGKPMVAVQLQDDDGSPIGLSVTFGRPLPDDRVSPEARLPLSS